MPLDLIGAVNIARLINDGKDAKLEQQQTGQPTVAPDQPTSKLTEDPIPDRIFAAKFQPKAEK